MQTTQEVALIVGTGAGLSASLARLFDQEVARDVDKLEALCNELGAERFRGCLKSPIFCCLGD